MTAGDLATCWILGGHRPPLQFGIKTLSFLAQSPPRKRNLLLLCAAFEAGGDHLHLVYRSCLVLIPGTIRATADNVQRLLARTGERDAGIRTRRWEIGRAHV